MKKRVIGIFILIVLFLIYPNLVFAHPGRLDSSGCHTCRTNCAKWGLRQGEYHCHGGSSNSKKNSSSSNKSNKPNNNTGSGYNKNNTKSNTNIVYKKSNNANLSSLKVDGEILNISTSMNFTTINNNPKITAVAEHSKATIKINKPDKFIYDSLNEVMINVKAEDGTAKQYKLLVNLVRTNANLKNLKIDNTTIEISDEMFFNTTNNKIKIEATTDLGAEIINDTEYDLELGDNKIILQVLAEDKKTTKNYVLNVKRDKLLSDNVGISVYINDEKVIFDNYASKIVYINNNIKEIDIKYNLENENASVELNYDKKINTGKKTINFIVTAENGKKQEYILNIYKYRKIEHAITYIIVILFMSGVGYFSYRFFKRSIKKYIKS